MVMAYITRGLHAPRPPVGDASQEAQWLDVPGECELVGDANLGLGGPQVVRMAGDPSLVEQRQQVTADRVGSDRRGERACDDPSARAHDPRHLRHHSSGAGHELEHGDRDGDVDHMLAQRKREGVCDHGRGKHRRIEFASAAIISSSRARGSGGTGPVRATGASSTARTRPWRDASDGRGAAS